MGETDAQWKFPSPFAPKKQNWDAVGWKQGLRKKEIEEEGLMSSATSLERES